MLKPASYKFTIDDFMAMVEVGIVPEDAPAELIRGEIVEMAASGPEHFFTVMRYENSLKDLYGSAMLVSTQNTILLSINQSAPEPDIALLKPPLSRYKGRLATPEDILLLIEVSLTTLNYDRNEKLNVYAEAGIQEVWIRNLVDNTLEVYREPSNKRYNSLKTYQVGQVVAPLAFPEQGFDWFSED